MLYFRFEVDVQRTLKSSQGIHTRCGYVHRREM